MSGGGSALRRHAVGLSTKIWTAPAPTSRIRSKALVRPGTSATCGPMARPRSPARASSGSIGMEGATGEWDGTRQS